MPHSSTRDYLIIQRRLLPHVHTCARWVLADKTGSRTRSYRLDNMDLDESKGKRAALDATHNLGNLYAD